jgi:hypothetical protein
MPCVDIRPEPTDFHLVKATAAAEGNNPVTPARIMPTQRAARGPWISCVVVMRG